MDWNTILAETITQVLVVVLPTVITYAITLAAKEFAELKRSEKYGSSLQFLQSMAETFVKAAFIEGEKNGWNGEARKDYVVERIMAAIAPLPVKFTVAEIEQIVDAIIEASYGDFVAWDKRRLVEARTEVTKDCEDGSVQDA